jgi:UDP:flavonoid glycosyltransferase YjiC (YdhE family)
MRITLATVGTRGDIVPFVALGIGLMRAGHEVRAVSWDLWREPFEAAGIDFTPAGPATTDSAIAETAEEAASARSALDQVAVLRDFHLRDGAAHAARLRTLLQDTDTAVLHGIHGLAVAAATDLGLPHATAVFDPVLLPTATAPPPGMPSLGPMNRGRWRMLARMLARLDAPLHAELARAGIGSSGISLFRGRSPRLHLVACSPSIMRVPDDLPSTTRVTGAWLDPRPPEPLPPEITAFLDAGPAPILVTFGSMANDAAAAHAAALMTALERTGLRAVVQGLPIADSDAVCRIGAVDHRALLPQVAMALHHGGAGTVHAVVGAGKPSVVVPHVGDQRYWADRLQRLGVAPPPLSPKAFDADRLTTAIRRATEPEPRERAARLGRALVTERGMEQAVEAIGASFGSGEE